VAQFRLSSPGFVEGGTIPRQHTCDGEGIPPHLIWSGAPGGTRSFVLIAEDPDAPDGTFTHWLVFDIPGDCTDLPSGARSDAVGVSGRNDSGTLGYIGPCPPSGTHRYVFHLSAVDIESLGLIAGVTRERIENAISGHTLQTADLTGRYGR